jgi:hypothetical protein
VEWSPNFTGSKFSRASTNIGHESVEHKFPKSQKENENLLILLDIPVLLPLIKINVQQINS